MQDNPLRIPRASHAPAVYLLVFFSLMLGSLYHVVKWDTYFFAVLPLQWKLATHNLTAEHAVQLKSICVERRQMDCVIEMNQFLVQTDRKKYRESLIELGMLFGQQKQSSQAIAALQLYAKLGGSDPKALLYFGQLLMETKKWEKAKLIYKKIQASSSNAEARLQATQKLVTCQIELNQWTEAKSTIENFRKLGAPFKSFMDDELQGIQRHIASVSGQ